MPLEDNVEVLALDKLENEVHIGMITDQVLCDVSGEALLVEAWVHTVLDELSVKEQVLGALEELVATA